jgi:hypothetical protein
MSINTLKKQPAYQQQVFSWVLTKLWKNNGKMDSQLSGLQDIIQEKEALLKDFVS